MTVVHYMEYRFEMNKNSQETQSGNHCSYLSENPKDLNLISNSRNRKERGYVSAVKMPLGFVFKKELVFLARRSAVSQLIVVSVSLKKKLLNL